MMLLPSAPIAVISGSSCSEYFPASSLPLPAAASATVVPSSALTLTLAPPSTSAFMASAEPASAANTSGGLATGGGGGGLVPSATAILAPPPPATWTGAGAGGAAGGGRAMALASTPLDRTTFTNSALPLCAATWISWRPWLSRCVRSVPRDTTVMAKGTLSVATAAATTDVPSFSTLLEFAPASRSAKEAEGTLL